MSNNEEKKPASYYRSKEFMDTIRQKAYAAKAQRRAEKEELQKAQKVIKQVEHEKVVKKAKELTKPPETHEPKEVQPQVEPEPSASKELNWKQEYYKTKLEMLRSKPKEAEPTAPTPKPTPAPHLVAKEHIHSAVNREVMKNLWTQYFREDCPY